MKTYIEFNSSSLECDNRRSFLFLAGCVLCLCLLLHSSVSTWEKKACKSATRSAALPDPYFKIECFQSSVYIITLTTTSGVFDFSAWQTVWTENGPPSRRIATIGMSADAVDVCISIRRKYFSIWARRKRTVSMLVDIPSNNRKSVWFGSKSRRFVSGCLTT